MSAFGRALHAEWTKFRTVPGWVWAAVVAAALIAVFGVLPSGQGSCGRNGPGSECVLPVGPDGEQVTDSFTFLHQPLSGDGSITVRVTALTASRMGPGQTVAGTVGWAKAGLIVRDGTGQGTRYAAIMVTPAHGVRMQDDYTHDTAGPPGTVSATAPRWLRLTRAGNLVTGAASSDGVTWQTVGSARLDGLPATVEAGAFVTSPPYAEEVSKRALRTGAMGGPSRATGTFDHLAVGGGWTAAAWRPDVIGAAVGPAAGGDPDAGPGAGVTSTGGVYRLTGSGDIAPAVAGAAGIGTTLSQTLIGTFAGLIVLVALGAVGMTAEYRRGLIRATLAATPGRRSVLAAKAVVVGTVGFAAGLAAAAVVVCVGQRVLRAGGVYVFPASAATEARLIVGTGALLAVAAVLALALGALLRRAVTAVTTAFVVIVLPYLLAMTVLPTGAARWLLRVSPAAAFAVQQAAAVYPQVENLYTPPDGYFPLAPWAGLAVLAAWAALALGAAALLMNRRDA